jgi:hypothetical protein
MTVNSLLLAHRRRFEFLILLALDFDGFEASRFDLAIGLPPGRYRIEARALWNAAAAAEIESTSTGDSAVVVLPLRR